MRRELIAYVALFWISVLGVWLFATLVSEGSFYTLRDWATPFALGACAVFLLLAIERIVNWLRRHL